MKTSEATSPLGEELDDLGLQILDEALVLFIQKYAAAGEEWDYVQRGLQLLNAVKRELGEI